MLMMYHIPGQGEDGQSNPTVPDTCAGYYAEYECNSGYIFDYPGQTGPFVRYGFSIKAWCHGSQVGGTASSVYQGRIGVGCNPDLHAFDPHAGNGRYFITGRPNCKPVTCALPAVANGFAKRMENVTVTTTTDVLCSTLANPASQPACVANATAAVAAGANATTTTTTATSAGAVSSVTASALLGNLTYQVTTTRNETRSVAVTAVNVTDVVHYSCAAGFTLVDEHTGSPGTRTCTARYNTTDGGGEPLPAGSETAAHDGTYSGVGPPYCRAVDRPDIVSATFSGAGGGVVLDVAFRNASVESTAAMAAGVQGGAASAALCARVFGSHAASLLDGASSPAQCAWRDLTTMTVVLAYGAAVRPGTSLPMASNALQAIAVAAPAAYNTQGAAATVAVAPGLLAQPFRVVLSNEPSTVGPCEDLPTSVGFAGITGLAEPAVTWTNSWSTSSGAARPATSTIPDGGTALTVTVSATNMFNMQATATSSTFSKTSELVPSVTFPAGEAFTVTSATALTVVAVPFFPTTEACSGSSGGSNGGSSSSSASTTDTTAMTTSKYRANTVSESRDRNTLLISGGSLIPGHTYTFQVVLSLSASSGVTPTVTRRNITVTVTLPEIKAKLQASIGTTVLGTDIGSITIGSQQSITLDAGASYDPVLLFISASATDGTDTGAIYSEGDPSWTSAQLDFSNSANFLTSGANVSTSFYVSPNVLVPGQNYTLTVQFGTGAASISFTVNSPPFGGGVAVAADAASAGTAGAVGAAAITRLTPLTAQVQGTWHDTEDAASGTPLRYAFSYAASASAQDMAARTYFGVVGLGTQLSGLRLPGPARGETSRTWLVVVDVIDSHGAMATGTTPVTVNRVATDDNEDALVQSMSSEVTILNVDDQPALALNLIGSLAPSLNQLSNASAAVGNTTDPALASRVELRRSMLDKAKSGYDNMPVSSSAVDLGIEVLSQLAGSGTGATAGTAAGTVASKVSSEADVASEMDLARRALEIPLSVTASVSLRAMGSSAELDLKLAPGRPIYIMVPPQASPALSGTELGNLYGLGAIDTSAQRQYATNSNGQFVWDMPQCIGEQSKAIVGARGATRTWRMCPHCHTFNEANNSWSAGDSHHPSYDANLTVLKVQQGWVFCKSLHLSDFIVSFYEQEEDLSSSRGTSKKTDCELIEEKRKQTYTDALLSCIIAALATGMLLSIWAIFFQAMNWHSLIKTQAYWAYLGGTSLLDRVLPPDPAEFDVKPPQRPLLGDKAAEAAGMKRNPLAAENEHKSANFYSKSPEPAAPDNSFLAFVNDIVDDHCVKNNTTVDHLMRHSVRAHDRPFLPVDQAALLFMTVFLRRLLVH
eukprot:g3685.t1